MAETKLLIVISKPIDMGPIDPNDSEKTAIEQSLNKYGVSPIQYKFLSNTTPTNLLVEIDDYRPDIVHFISHGNQDAEIVLVNNEGKSKPVPHEALKKLFQAKMVRMVLMNACYSVEQATVIRNVVDCVIGMNAPISNPAATVFAAEFYRNIGKGDSVLAAFKDAQRALDLDDDPDKIVPEIKYRKNVDGDELFFTNKSVPSQETQPTAVHEAKPTLTIETEEKEDQPASPTSSIWGRIPVVIWTAIIGGIVTVITVLGPPMLDILRQPEATSLPTAVAVETLSPTLTPTPAPTALSSIQSIVRQPVLSLEDVLSIQEYLRGSAPEAEKGNVIWSLGKPGWTNVIPILQEIILNSRDTTTKQTVVSALAKIGGQSAQVALLSALNYDPNDSILRENIINALGDLPDNKSDQTIYQIKSILVQTSEDTIVVKTAVKTLGKLNAVTAVDEIIELLHRGDQLVRSQAAQTLSKFDLPQVKEALRQAAANDTAINTRVVAINSLIILRDEEAIPLFSKLQEQDENESIRQAAREAVYRITGQVTASTNPAVTAAPTPTDEGRTVSALSLKKGITGTARSELSVQLTDSSLSDPSTTYTIGTRVKFIVIAPDNKDLALIDLPDGKQGWVNVSSVSWFSDTTAAPPHLLWPNGKVIKIAFLDGEPEVQKKVEKYAQEWTKYANLTFDFGEYKDAEVRVSFKQDTGSWSYIGTQALNVPANQPTINLGWLTRVTAEQEVQRVVLHNFGHVLGLSEEHENPNNTIPWNKEAVYKYFGGPPNLWSKYVIDRNIFTLWAPGTYQVEKEFDRNSIMTFPVSKELTYNNYEIGWNTELSAGDRAFAAMLYPKPLLASANNEHVHYTWFGNVSPNVVGIAGSAAEADAGNEIRMNGEMHGAFSGIFLPLLRDEKADINADGFVSLDEAVLTTGIDLRKQVFRQSPLIVGDNTDFVLFSLKPNVAPPSHPKRLEVLLVGINDYTPPIPTLRSPVNDVKLFEKLLKEEEYVAADEVHVTLLTDKAASAENIKNTLETLINGADSSTAILFYYSGHNSVKESQHFTNVREKAIIPADATSSAGYISVAELAAWLDQSKAKYKILIIDA